MFLGVLLVAQQVKDPVLSLLWLSLLLWVGFNPWPQNFCMPRTPPKTNKQKKKKKKKKALNISSLLHSKFHIPSPTQIIATVSNRRPTLVHLNIDTVNCSLNTIFLILFIWSILPHEHLSPFSL